MPKTVRRRAYLQQGWNIKPDMIIEMPKPFELPATGTIDYQFILVKGNIQEDIWAKEAEMRPSEQSRSAPRKGLVRPPARTGWRT